jgi:hypothetical protein
MPSPKKTKKTETKNVVEEVQLDAITVDEPKKVVQKTPHFHREENEMNWDDTPKKQKNTYDSDDFDGEEEESGDENEEEEDETFFREK